MYGVKLQDKRLVQYCPSITNPVNLEMTKEFKLDLCEDLEQ